MNNIPQAVTERYVTHLLNRGQNRDFQILHIYKKASWIDQHYVGAYYEATICSHVPDAPGETGTGASPSQALRRALEKHGVTFR